MASSSLSRNWEHDVFPSFHGQDVRQKFLSHVLKEFRRKAINLFIDNEIKRGEFIGPELKRAIRGSKIAVVLLSKNYASSSWCLDELVEIMKQEFGQTVITIFYEIDPTDVKKQTGIFGEVFKNTCKGKDKKKIDTWRKALEGVATIAGYHSSNWVDEAAMIEYIAADISKMLIHLTPSRDFDRLIGMEDHMEKMEKLLRLDLDEVRMIGIWGPSGIGKTTIGRFLFNQVSNEFQNCAMMVNIKGSYPRPCFDEYNAQLQLQSQMLSQMINQKDIMIPHLGVAQGRLGDKKVLIVLDDVDRLAQLDALAKDVKWFGPRSRIIITTEDLGLLKAHGINHIYKVKFPSNDEALQMFCMYAFDQKSPKDGFDVLASEITYLVGKLPLALKVMGSYFRGLSKEQWSMEVPRLRTNLNGEIESVLRFSYDVLCDEDKDLFLHIACFFNYEYMVKVEAFLAESFKNVRQRLHVLTEKSLIFIDYDRICMHNMLAQLGKDIVRKQSVREPGQREFLVDNKDIREVLTDCSAITKSVIGIDSKDGFDTAKETFEGICSLQFLRVRYKFPKIISSLPPKLRLLDWKCSPMKCLPFTINLEFLIELRMHCSNLTKLWDEIKLLRNLKWMDLSNSKNLKKLPNLSMATNLRVLNLSDCSSLAELPNLSMATNLRVLNLSDCSSLVELPSSIGNAMNLNKLDLIRCSSLVDLPSSIGNLHRITSLSLKGCSKLKALPININMESLNSLDLTDCSLLTRFPEISTNISYLNLVGTSIKEVPCSIRSLSRINTLHMPYCENLMAFPYIHNNIVELHSSNLAIEELGPWVRGLSHLKELVLKGMQKLVSLPKLPDSLSILNLNGCSSLVSLPKLPDSLSILNLNGCSSLVSLPKLPDFLSNLNLNGCSSLVSLPQLPDSLRFLHLNGCSSLVSLPQLPDLLRFLYLDGCSSLVSLPQLPDFLRNLNLNGCSSLVSLPQIPDSLSNLNLNGCSSLVSLSQLPNSLGILDLNGCSSLVSLPQLPDSLRSLNLNGCSSLISLLKLPDSLMTLNAENCESLQILDCSFGNSRSLLKFVNCLKLNREARDLIIHISSTVGLAILPGKEVPECFTYRAYGNSLTVKLNQNPLHTSTKFKACILLDNKCEYRLASTAGFVYCPIESKQNLLTARGSYRRSLDPIVTEHLYIFDIEASEVTSTELVFKFELEFNLKIKSWRIKECGICRR